MTDHIYGREVITLNEFIFQRQKDFTYATGELTSLLTDIGIAAKIVNREVNKAGLVDILGNVGLQNVQGELVKKLDVFANEQFISSLASGGQCAGIASEENEDFVSLENEQSQHAKYIVTIDPLDGSSNIDVNVSIGTIFSIYRRKSSGKKCEVEDFLQKGTEQVAAGYIIYGSSTMLVFTTGKGVNGFTLDPSIGEFCLSHPSLQIPEEASVYSINQGYYHSFSEGVKQFIDDCQKQEKPCSLRYIGSMVADIHRNLIQGGIFIYPATKSQPSGKLRLLYECNPIAFIVEQAGGIADSGSGRIMEIEPKKLHERTPIFTGSKNMVNKALKYLHQFEMS
ncbi:MAG: class 1 fructose-bisphosphatase [Chitinophagaceae bacterium]|nr:MAG: class 1 fructose-bisphosphatase [Chitinophagaceae bacterium]